MVVLLDSRLVVSPRELQVIQRYLNHQKSSPVETTQSVAKDDFNAAAFRSASRVFVGVGGSLRLAEAILERVSRRGQKALTSPQPRKPLVASETKLALSLSSLLFFHRVLYRLFARLRLQLLHEKVQSVRDRYPKLYGALTSRLAPAVAASLSGLALGICPSDQLRVTLAIYIASRACELAYGAIDGLGYTKNKPWWFGSWLLVPLAQGQLLHSFVFDPDCFPEAYGSFIIGYTPEYIQRRPTGTSSKVAWPSTRQIVDSIAEIAQLRWPPFVSLILHPTKPTTLPAGVSTAINPIISRAHPAQAHLSCALIHPSQTSCLLAYIRQNLLSFPQIARFFTIYYAALSLLRVKSLFKAPITFLNKLSKQILLTSIAVSGQIGLSWGTICFWQQFLPRALLPEFRFFLGGLLGGVFQIVDRTASGHANAMYVARTSVDSVWKVGVKKRWWRPVKAGDVWLFVAAVAVYNVVYDISREKEMEIGEDRSMKIVKFFRGEADPEPSSEDNEKQE